MMYQADLVSRITHAAQHPIFRVAAVIFSVFSSLAVYDFFLPLATDWLWHIVLVGMTAAFVALNYFTLRGLSHRLLQKRPIISYVLVGLLCFVVEVVCNLSHASQVYLTGAQAAAFHQMMFWPVLVVLCSMPIFGAALAVIDVDLMAEKGAIPSHPVNVRPMQPNPSMYAPPGSSPAAANPRAYYPQNPNPAASQGAGQSNNNLQNHYNAKKTQSILSKFGVGMGNAGNAVQPQPQMQPHH
jgi:hypothetical protein